MISIACKNTKSLRASHISILKLFISLALLPHTVDTNTPPSLSTPAVHE
jgi:hypothetical protein